MRILDKKNVVAGLGEIGSPILRLVSKAGPAVGYDVNPKLMDEKKFKKYENLQTSFLHICIPFSEKFIENVTLLSKKLKPECIVIHSTISPGTTTKIQNLVSIPVIYSATRGVHKRMLYDMKRYTKFYAVEPTAPNGKWASSAYSKLLKSCGVKTKQMSTPLTLELAKIVVDTSYYGWLINYAQLSNMIAIQHKVNYDEMWSFSDEIHKFLGNRPKMFPGFIGGHCVIPNLDLIHNQTLDLIKEINDTYAKKVKNTKTLAKKYKK
jgi:UDP-N-acetyl-D-mannosaminuronate dehydrogenase